jgi:L-fuconolactonase
VLAGARELPAVVEAARAVPEVTMVVDHLGKPDVAAGSDEVWASAMKELGALPNLWCKVSGGFAAAFAGGGGARRVDALAPFVAGVREWFGDGRLLFGSDWPVSTLAAPYDDVVACWRELLVDLSPADREATFGGNARRVYGLR